MITLLLPLLLLQTSALAPPQTPGVILREIPTFAMPAGEAQDAAQSIVDAAIAKAQLGGGATLLLDQGHSLTAQRFLFQRTASGIPIRGAYAKVVLWHSGGAAIEMESTPAPTAAPTIQLTEEDAIAATLDLVFELPDVESELFPGLATLQWHKGRLIYTIPYHDLNGNYDFEALVDANTGNTLPLVDHRIMYDGHGQVFIPNPVQTADDHTLTDNNDSANAVPSSEYFDVVLQGLDGSGYLAGPFVDLTPTSGRVRSSTLDFNYNRSQDGFEQTMVYYHMDEFQRYIQSLGMMNANNRAQRVDVNGSGQDNSWYSPSSRTITYGRGGVDDAEDADIIVHEYGHALHHDLQGNLPNGENGAMGEGYGDFYAALFYDDPLVGEWDAVSYTGNQTYHYLRRTDGNRKYPEDKGGEVHKWGEVWSAMLWDVRIACGRDIALTLTIEGCALQSPNSGMVNGSYWMRRAEEQLYAGTWLPYLAWAQHKRGFLDLAAITPVVLNVDDSSLPANRGTAVTISAPNYAGHSYQLLPSLFNTGGYAGSPFDLDLSIDTDGASYSASIPNGIGALDALGEAEARIRIPGWIGLDQPIYLQTVVFVPGANNVASNPAAIKGVVH